MGMAERRVDPRAEPTSSPPPEGPASIREQVVLSTVTADHVPAESLPTTERKSVAPVMNGDPRVVSIERRMQDNDWRGIATELGSLSDVGRLPPNLGLFAALAHHETSPDGDQEAVDVGVRCMAGILGVPERSAMAGVIARRLFRRNPIRFRERKAPTARISTLIILGGLVLGGTIGWLSSGGERVARGLAHQVMHLIHP